VVQLLDRSELSESQRRLIRLLKSSSDNMLNLLTHVLDLSKAESTGFALVEAPFALKDVVDDVVATFATAARGQGLQLHSAIGEDVPSEVVGDPVAIRQILTNLVGNAVKFTAAGSVTVTVGARELSTDAATVTFAVSDTGIGIAPEAIERIFNEFTQASYQTAMRFGGSGLGLTITRRLLALYGSSVEVQSAIGEGSTFSFALRLPVPTGKRGF
jgi:signal transduction histidine kinase